MRLYSLEPHHLRLLEGAATSWDRAVECRVLIAAEGAVVRDRFGQAKPHPAAGIERDSLVAFARLCRELGFDSAIPPGGGR